MRNGSAETWTNVQVYLNIDPTPVTTHARFAEIAATDPNVGFGTGPTDRGSYAQIDMIGPGTSKRFALRVSMDKLPPLKKSGVYHVEIRVLGTDDQGRDSVADARAATFMPLMQGTPAQNTTPVLLLWPLTAPVHRWPDGSFMDDSLGPLIAPGGRLADIVELARRAPRAAVQVLVDPAVFDAVTQMAKGYRVRTMADQNVHHRGQRGPYRRDAQAWLRGLGRLSARGQVVATPYATPDASTLTAKDLGSLVTTTVNQAKRVALPQGWPTDILGWTADGLMIRRTATELLEAGAQTVVLSDQSLIDSSEPRPPYITFGTRNGDGTAIVTRTTLAGRPITAATDPSDLARELLDEATVSSLSSSSPSALVVATPSTWDPGPAADATKIFDVYKATWLAPTTVPSVESGKPTRYNGPIRPQPEPSAALSARHLVALQSFNRDGRTFAALAASTAISTDTAQDLSLAASAYWRLDPEAGQRLVDLEAERAQRRLQAVTVSGPGLVALSSSSGRFPLTVTNRLSVPVTLKLVTQTTNSELDLRTVAKVTVEPNQRRDIDVFGSARNSTVSTVTVHLSTLTGREFGRPWVFDVRTTQYGLLIWLTMVAGAIVLFGTAGWRVFKRVRRARQEHAIAAGTRP